MEFHVGLARDLLRPVDPRYAAVVFAADDRNVIDGYARHHGRQGMSDLMDRYPLE